VLRASLPDTLKRQCPSTFSVLVHLVYILEHLKGTAHTMFQSKHIYCIKQVRRLLLGPRRLLLGPSTFTV
jgi:hypothetical protein